MLEKNTKSKIDTNYIFTAKTFGSKDIFSIKLKNLKTELTTLIKR